MKKATCDLNPHSKLKHFPMLPADKLAALMESIKTKGMLKPLTITKKGLVIDGRNRLLAALKIGLEEVPVEIVEGHPDPVLYAIETAATGRQLTKTGLCLLLIEQHPDLAGERKNRKSPGVCHKLTDSLVAIADQYQVPRQYFSYVAHCMDLCRNETDRERLRVMVYEMEVCAVNLEKGILGWQASHPVDEEVSDEDLHEKQPVKKNAPKVDDILIRCFYSATKQAANWDKLPDRSKHVIRDEFVSMWKVLPDELKRAVR